VTTIAMNTLVTRSDISLAPISRQIVYADIQRFAVLSNDFNPIHVDREFAATSPMKGLIAHGPMATIMVWQMLDGALDASELQRVTLELRFERPMRENDTVTVDGKLSDDQSAGLSFDVRVRNQRDETVIQGTAIVRPAAEVGLPA
jgi:3-hydroxybutyryl-CoA dehydratase